MKRIMIPAAAALLALALAAGCGGRYGSAGGGQTVMLPQLGPDLVVMATLPKDTIGVEYYKEGIGAIKSAKWKTMLSSYTQQSRSQSLGFPPKTEITIRNISSKETHTLDVVKVIAGPPAQFPQNIKLSVKAAGNGVLQAGYASGPIKPGQTVKVTLEKAGIYLIGCAFHYSIGMRDVLVVAPHAAPGPQATPTPHGGGGGGGSGSGSGSGWGG